MTWRRVVYAADCDEDGNCPRCGIDYADCPCPGPTMDDMVYKEVDGILYARSVLTAAQRRALGILADHSPIRPREFARLMWPDSKFWNRTAKCGHGVHRGGGMYTAGGAYLGRLERLGFTRRINWEEGYTITASGHSALLASGA